MKKALLLLVGLLPFLIGTVLNYLVTNLFFDTALPFGLIGLLFLAGWAASGFFLYPLAGSAKLAALLVHLPAVLALLLILYQELVLGRYWMSIAGLATQFYFLPLVYLGARVTSFLSSIPAVYVASFALMCGAFSLGCWMRKSR